MRIRLAFAGLRHAHIDALYAFACRRNDVEVVGAAEDDSVAAQEACRRGIEVTEDSVDALFDRAADFDALAVGDYYGRRGSLAIRALEAGKHVISDKPLCTSLDELERIAELRDATDLVVGCMLSNRDAAQFRTAKRLYDQGTIGELQTITFMGQHPLLYGTRPGWYFENGKHGGTLNDIAIHAVDVIPWLFGVEWRSVLAARVWNTRLPEHPHFQVGAQAMLDLEGGAGVIGDVSYLSPDSQGYTVPQYWRYTIHGTGGIMETGLLMDEVRIYRDGTTEPETVRLDPGRTDGVLIDFLKEISGSGDEAELTSARVIRSSRTALEIQRAADTRRFPVRLRDEIR